jgi:hypothetical protein
MVEPGTMTGSAARPRIVAAREQAMTYHEYLAKARQGDAQRAGERDRLLLKARRAHIARCHRTGPIARAWRLARLMLRRLPHSSPSQPALASRKGRQ